MGKLISGKEAKLAWANGENVYLQHNYGFVELTDNYNLSIFDQDGVLFKLKPRTITINGVEFPAPFEPKEGEKCCYITDDSMVGFHTVSYDSERHGEMIFGLYRPSDIEQVVEALRSIFK